MPRLIAGCCYTISAASRSILRWSLICARSTAVIRPSLPSPGPNGAPISHWAIEWPGLATSWHKQLARRPNEASGGSSSSWIPSWASVTITDARICSGCRRSRRVHRQPTLCGETRIPSLIAASSYPLLRWVGRREFVRLAAGGKRIRTRSPIVVSQLARRTERVPP
jgi:hypothetical protein